MAQPAAAGAEAADRLKEGIGALTALNAEGVQASLNRASGYTSTHRMALSALADALELDAVHSETLKQALNRIPGDQVLAAILETAINGWAMPKVSLLGALLTRMPRPDASMFRHTAPGGLMALMQCFAPEARPLFEYDRQTLMDQIHDEYRQWYELFQVNKDRSGKRAYLLDDAKRLGNDVLWGNDVVCSKTEVGTL